MLELVLTGMSDAQVATALSTKTASVSPQAVTQFRDRHADQIAGVQAERLRLASDYAIAHTVNRVATNDMLKNLLLDVRAARAAGGTGMETGLVVKREKALGSGRNMTVVEEYEIDPALVTLIDRLHSSTADELGQKPRSSTLDLSDRRTYVLQIMKANGGNDLG